MNITVGLKNSEEQYSEDIIREFEESLCKAVCGYYRDSKAKCSFVYQTDSSVTIDSKWKLAGSEPQVKKTVIRVFEDFFISESDALKVILNGKEEEKTMSESVPKSTEPTNNAKSESKKVEEFDYKKIAENYHAEEPRFTFEQVILSEDIKNQITEAIATIRVAPVVFEEWGLKSIIKNATSALNFFGPPGTGKSMAAEAIAHMLGKKVLRVTLADIESRYVGASGKMLKAVFYAAQRDDAVLFLDEADSLLSKRLTNVEHGNEQVYNSMRSEVTVCLDNYSGIVIFATNLVVNYDNAFLSRLININFVLPDTESRKKIWYQHTKGSGLHIPLSEDVDLDKLAEKYEFCGRDIKNAVKDACVCAAMRDSNDKVYQADFEKACEKIKTEAEKLAQAKDYTSSKTNLTDEQRNALKASIERKLQKKSESIDADNAKESEEDIT